MSFINPSYLWALLGLLIPIAIHLWSKKEGKTIKIGSIKLLSEADSRQSSSIKLNEIVLLIIRLLIISLLVFIMAEPQIKLKTLNSPITYIIEPSLIEDASITDLIDSLQSEAPILFLKKGFPEISTDINDTGVPNYWQLAKAMASLPTDSIIVISNGFSTGLKGKRPQVNKNIEWLILDIGAPVDNVFEAVNQGNNVQIRTLKSNSEHVTFKKENLSLQSPKLQFNQARDSLKIAEKDNQDWQIIQGQAPIEILLFYEDKFNKEAIYIEAAFNAISKHIEHPLSLTKVQDTIDLNEASYNYVIWLSEQNKPETSAKTLYYKSNNFASSIITKGVSRNEYYLTKALNTEIILEEHLPEQLIAFLDLHPNLNQTINTHDKRIVSKHEITPNIQSVDASVITSNILYISPWLWLLLALLLITERFISNFRKQ